MKKFIDLFDFKIIEKRNKLKAKENEKIFFVFRVLDKVEEKKRT